MSRSRPTARAARCRQCRARLPPSQPRLVVNWDWLCPDCAYTLEYGRPTETHYDAAEPVEAPTLFDPEPYRE